MKISAFLFITLISIASVSCTKTTSISGKAVNKYTGEGIPNAHVYLLLGQQSTNGFLGSSGDEEGYVSSITDGNGNFSIEAKSDIIEIIGAKEGYSWVKTTDAGLTGNQISPGEYNNYLLQFEGDATFDSPFIRLNQTEENDDSELTITLLSYSSFEESYIGLNPREKSGKGPHYFTLGSSDIPVIGDRYLRYKLEFTTPDGWETVIDSVFIPTSSEVYNEPIYY